MLATAVTGSYQEEKHKLKYNAGFRNYNGKYLIDLSHYFGITAENVTAKFVRDNLSERELDVGIINFKGFMIAYH